jgi:hypothetical protein
MKLSTSTLQKLAVAAALLVLACVLKLTDHAAGALPLGLLGMAGMAWSSNEHIVQWLASVGFADATYGVLSPRRNVLAKTADYVVLGTEPAGTVFTTRGAAGAVNFTLPQATPQRAGLWYRFKNAVDQNLTVTATPADSLIVFNDLTADSIALSTAGQKIGGEIEVFCDGTSWFAAGVSVAHTFTIAT